MYFLSKLALAATTALIGGSIAFPIVVSPGDAGNVQITSNNTVNATAVPVVNVAAVNTGALPLSFVNNLAGGAVNAYVTGLDVNNQLVMLQPNGQWYYPTCDSSSGVPQAVTGDVAIPLGAKGSTIKITLPGGISAGRVWFAEGTLQFFVVEGASGPSLVEPSAVNPSDPSADVNWGFVELTNTAEGGLYANISYVDFVGLILGMSLTDTAGNVQTAYGLSSNAVASLCEDLKTQSASDRQAWSDLCVTSSSTGQPLRVLAPTDYVSINPSAFVGYWDSYISSVWSYYTTNKLTVNTQASAGNVDCTVDTSTNLMTCAGDNRGYAQPTTEDIFGCNSGPFAIESTDNDVHVAVVPRLCAAFHRSTYMSTGGDIQPGPAITEYYLQGPTNWYSAFVHKYEVDGKGYAFSYDDVTADASVNESGEVSCSSPAVLEVTIGGPSSS